METLPIIHIDCEINNDKPFHLYEKVLNGEKRYELRLLLPPKDGEKTKWWSFYPGMFDTKRSTLKVVNANNKTEFFERYVVGSVVSVGYRALIDYLGVGQCIPGAKSTEEAIERVYKRFYPDKLVGYEVVALELGDIV